MPPPTPKVRGGDVGQLPLGGTQESQPETRYDPLIYKFSEEFGVDPNLVKAIMRVESNFDPNAVSPKKAKGLMQLMEGTGKEFGVENFFDPEENIRGGVRYLKWLEGQFDSRDDVIAAYNAGPTAVREHGGVPPGWGETEQYLQRVNALLPEGVQVRGELGRVPSSPLQNLSALTTTPPSLPVYPQQPGGGPGIASLAGDIGQLPLGQGGGIPQFLSPPQTQYSMLPTPPAVGAGPPRPPIGGGAGIASLAGGIGQPPLGQGFYSPGGGGIPPFPTVRGELGRVPNTPLQNLDALESRAGGIGQLPLGAGSPRWAGSTFWPPAGGAVGPTPPAGGAGSPSQTAVPGGGWAGSTFWPPAGGAGGGGIPPLLGPTPRLPDVAGLGGLGRVPNTPLQSLNNLIPRPPATNIAAGLGSVLSPQRGDILSSIAPSNLPAIPQLPGPQPPQGGDPGIAGVTGQQQGGDQAGLFRTLFSNPQFLQGFMQLVAGTTAGRHGGAAGQGVSDAFQQMRDIQNKEIEQAQAKRRIDLQAEQVENQRVASAAAAARGVEEIGLRKAEFAELSAGRLKNTIAEALQGEDLTKSFEDFKRDNPNIFLDLNGNPRKNAKLIYAGAVNQAARTLKQDYRLDIKGDLDLIGQIAQIAPEGTIPPELLSQLDPQVAALVPGILARSKEIAKTDKQKQRAIIEQSLRVAVPRGGKVFQFGMPGEGGEPSTGEPKVVAEGFPPAETQIRARSSDEMLIAMIQARGSGTPEEKALAEQFIDLKFPQTNAEDRAEIDAAITFATSFLGYPAQGDLEAIDAFMRTVKSKLAHRPDLVDKLGTVVDFDPGFFAFSNIGIEPSRVREERNGTRVRQEPEGKPDPINMR